MNASEAVERTTPTVRKLWNLTAGKAWEPRDPQSPLVVKLIADGWLKRTDGICGYERFKDSMVVWTEAARQALTERTPDDAG